ncbi:PREDICTED: caspase-1-like [Ceratosolen solmsi marchali]|uniref:Caspase-1-like n=1 Tax=Ceratosolen solmsi marchali TaxID=326594 RepID=A0AAJ7DWY6_9HYME|nr:PREDICTED: caspase-1-like [Ceratosolen solmsi marchali]
MFTYKNLGTRRCADAEATLVKQTFKNLGFDVFIYKDYTYQQIKKLLTNLSSDDYKKDDCICIFILTHGEAKGLIWALDACYPINIYEETLSNIQTLADKPKLIFVQARIVARVDGGTHLIQQKSDYIDEINRK